MKCKFQSEYESYTFILAFFRNRDLSAILYNLFYKIWSYCWRAVSILVSAIGKLKNVDVLNCPKNNLLNVASISKFTQVRSLSHIQDNTSSSRVYFISI